MKKRTVKPMTYVRVVNCEKLNIRESPIATAKVVWVADKGTILMTPSFSPDRPEVYSMDNPNRVGYALKDYLEVVTDVQAEEEM